MEQDVRATDGATFTQYGVAKREPSPFEQVVNEILELHKRKGADYGQDEDEYANVRASQEFGIEPWLGALLRGNDKVSRLKTFAKRRTLRNEGVEDSLIDLAVYAIIALVLWREANAPETKTNEA